MMPPPGPRVDLALDGGWGQAVVFVGGKPASIPLSAAAQARRVDLSGEAVSYARSLGIVFGNE